jgi:hypothetical protein
MRSSPFRSAETADPGASFATHVPRDPFADNVVKPFSMRPDAEFD